MTSTLLNGLVGAFNFNNNITDSTGSLSPTNYGTSNNDNGKINECRDFDGGDYIDLNSQSFDTANGTIAFWFKPNSVSTSFLIGDRSSSTVDYFYIAFDSSKINARIRSSGTAYDMQSTNTVSTGSWYHLVFTWGSTGIKLYINNSLEASSTYTGTWSANSDMEVGRVVQYAPLYYYTGSMDMLYFWNRQLSNDERSELYNSCNGNEYPFSQAGWTGIINGVTNPSKVNGIPVVNISKINQVS